jgi:hypothetical protein
MGWLIAAYGVVAVAFIGYRIHLQRARRDLER